jgi:hypothetical protein
MSSSFRLAIAMLSAIPGDDRVILVPDARS